VEEEEKEEDRGDFDDNMEMLEDFSVADRDAVEDFKANFQKRQ
jgi:hypothetical protein